MDAREKILKIIKELGSVYQKDLKHLTGVSKSRISEIISELEKEGLIRRERIIGKSYKIYYNSKVLKIGIIKAAEYPFIMPLIKIMKNNNIDVKVKIYENGIKVTKALILGEIDIGFSPLITQLLFSKIFDNIKIIAGASKGGSGVIGLDDKIIGSTEISTMQILVKSIVKDSKVKYYSNPEDMINALEKREVNSVAIWEPYFTYLYKRGYKLLYKFPEIHCCTLAINSKIDEDVMKKYYEEAFSLFNSDKEKWIRNYAELLGMDKDLILKSSLNYKFESYLDINDYLNFIKQSKIDLLTLLDYASR
jgi:predicted transcriptional regulator